MKKIIFITGTDTGAGKTLLTALLLCWARNAGIRALAMKPFCSGSRADAELLFAVQSANSGPVRAPASLPVATLDEINPFYYPEPVAPAASAAKQTTLKGALSKIHGLADRCDLLLVEGSGGLMVPLGPGFNVRDVISSLKCHVIVAGLNKLGVINHALLTLEALQNVHVKYVKLVLMGLGVFDESVAKNSEFIQKLSPKTTVFEVPWLGKKASNTREIKNNAKKIKKTLAGLVGSGYIDRVL